LSDIDYKTKGEGRGAKSERINPPAREGFRNFSGRRGSASDARSTSDSSRLNIFQRLTENRIVIHARANLHIGIAVRSFSASAKSITKKKRSRFWRRENKTRCATTPVHVPTAATPIV
jgi:hypothetical protein